MTDSSKYRTIASPTAAAVAATNGSSVWAVGQQQQQHGQGNVRRVSEWSLKDTEDLYCDDELRGDDPNLQLQIVAKGGMEAIREVVDNEAAAAAAAAAASASAAAAGTRYPPHPMLVDQGNRKDILARRGIDLSSISESILSMDIGSTGPTSLRSNYTDDTDATNDGPDEITLDTPDEK